MIVAVLLLLRFDSTFSVAVQVVVLLGYDAVRASLVLFEELLVVMYAPPPSSTLPGAQLAVAVI